MTPVKASSVMKRNYSKTVSGKLKGVPVCNGSMPIVGKKRHRCIQ